VTEPLAPTVEQRVRSAAAGWVWVPPGASEARTPEYHLIAYPPALAVPDQVAWCRSDRPAGDVVDELVAVARAWRLDELSFWLGAETRHADLAEVLRARGAVHLESVELLARELGGSDDGTDDDTDGTDGTDGTVAGVEVRQVRDAATLADADVVTAEVWGTHPRPAEDTDRLLEQLTGPDAAELRVVAYVDGEPACTGGCTFAADSLGGEVARLWGGATRPSLRGRGAYRASVAARLALARRRGTDLAVVRAVTTTSAPIVRRLGFTAHGTDHRLRLDLGRQQDQETTDG
jgi:GNAT superfamily N-acetyltransferase